MLQVLRFLLVPCLAIASCAETDKPSTSEPPPVASAAPVPAPSTKARDADAQSVLEEQLDALGYLDAVEAPEAEGRGVLVHDPTKSQAGWTLLAPRGLTEARLLAADGEVVHQWQADLRIWKLAIPRPNGDLLVLDQGRGVLRIDRASRVLWRTDFRARHDLVVDVHEHIWALSSRKREVSLDGANVWLTDNTIVELSSNGEILQELSLLDAVDRRYWEPRLRYGIIADERGYGDPKTLGAPRDVFHANSVDVVSQAIPGICEKGALLVSMRSLDLVAIIDRSSKKMVWHAPTDFVDHQHHATFLDNGHLLVFDNGPANRRSRVLEIDPVGPAIVWKYDPGDIFTKMMGAAQPLPNGNVLITVSHQAELREVTRTGEIVWQYAIPERSEKNPRMFRTAYRATRIPAGFFDADVAAAWTRH